MKKHHLILFLFTFFLNPLSAQIQTKTRSIRATIIDSVDSKPVGYASISLKSGSEVVKTTTANELGVVELSGIPAGKFLLIAGFVGYRSKLLSFEITDTQPLSLI
ncbi:carboxypeptidase regulatory-like domain-containing protein [Desertivirga brevis]|uniref:carboxypeptidase regulatory-like domain-containing protein n=1 Tax=Desertivirga brevis TaxID=2810310 RepID=UPI001A95D835|nr:carboxypeptidase regulatory-like domain-containing protein [Pedobacter sp. SYSU D00873]